MKVVLELPFHKVVVAVKAKASGHEPAIPREDAHVVCGDVVVYADGLPGAIPNPQPREVLEQGERPGCIDVIGRDDDTSRRVRWRPCSCRYHGARRTDRASGGNEAMFPNSEEPPVKLADVNSLT